MIGSAYSRVSKNIGWNHKPVEMPTMEEVVAFSRNCEDNVQSFMQIFFWWRFCRMAENDQQRLVMDKIHEAFKRCDVWRSRPDEG